MPRWSMLPRALGHVAPALLIGALLAAGLWFGFVPRAIGFHESGISSSNDAGAVNLLSLVGNVLLLTVLLAADRWRDR